MDDKTAELDALRERALTLQDTIEDIDYQIERAMHAVAAGTSHVGHAMTVLESRRNDHAGLMFELGKVTARIENMESRIREHEERGRENQTVEEWQEHAPVGEDHLDWLRPVIEAQVPDDRDPSHREEEREREDYLDWLKRGGYPAPPSVPLLISCENRTGVADPANVTDALRVMRVRDTFREYREDRPWTEYSPTLILKTPSPILRPTRR